MKLDWRLVLVLVLSLGLMVGCESDEEETVVGTYDDVSTYMTDNGLDLPDLLASWVIAASSVIDTNDYQTVAGYTVLDIRAEADFLGGHIDGAINTTLGGIITSAEANTGKPYLVACYTGQTAGQAVMALKLMGYEAYVLKFGMSSWNEAFQGPWAAVGTHEAGNKAAGHENWVTSAAPALGSFDAPDWDSETTEGAALLVERVEAMLAAGFPSVDGHTTATSVLEAPANYQIINYWAEADYLAFGHFDGAVPLLPISIEGGEVAAIDPATTSAVYCYTGQTSSMVTFWLNVLGYDAVSIKYGVNALNYDGLSAAGKPAWHGPYDYNYVEG